MSGKGSLKLSPRSQVLFSGKYEYTAELEAGAVVMNSVTGPNDLHYGLEMTCWFLPSKSVPRWRQFDRAPDGSSWSLVRTEP